MENKKDKKVALNDELLDMVSGGLDEIGLRLEKCSLCNMMGGDHAETCPFYKNSNNPFGRG